jgi:hypothetical protein
VAIPSADQEAARDLVRARAREDCRGDPMRARHRLSKLLLRPGITAMAVVGPAGAASAAPADAACFGQVHKTVNSGALGIDNVGQLVKALGGGQAKNRAAASFCP